MTSVTTYTTTLAESLGVLQCVLARYIVYNIAYTTDSTFAYGYSTETTNLQTYVTTTSATQPVGYATTYTSTYSTFSGVHALANITSCAYVAG